MNAVCYNNMYLAIPCNISEIMNPVNGNVSIDGLTATYTCNTGYILNGTEKRICGNDTKWSPLDTPICESKSLYISFCLIFHYNIIT